MMERGKSDKNRDDIFDHLKLAVISSSQNEHKWDGKAEDSLVSCSLV